MIEIIKTVLCIAGSYLLVWRNPNPKQSFMTITSAWLVLIVLYLSFGGK